MEYFTAEGQPHVIIRLDPGDRVLESIRAVIATEQIRDGAVASAFGTLSRCRLHVVTTTDFPATERFLVYEEPLELVQISGVIAGGVPHLHFTVSDGVRAFGGHLEDGNVVLYLAEVVLVRWDAPRLERRPDEWGIRRLERGS